MQYLIPIGLLVGAWFFIPWSVSNLKRNRRGRLGSAMTGLSDALDPRRAAILLENEREADRHGEREDDEPVDDPDEEPASSGREPLQ